MPNEQELRELRQALAQSPENGYLRRLLISKLRGQPGYEQELEEHLQVLIRKEPQDIELKEILIEAYFAQKKYSTCLIIFEELGNHQLLSPPTRVLLAKCYLKDGDQAKAAELYQAAVLEDDSIADAELDQQFRMAVAYEEDEDDLDERIMTKPDMSFADVGGLDAVKREIDLKIIKPLEHADLYKSYGKKVGGGILLYGPPGCGKTYIARATAGQINANSLTLGSTTSWICGWATAKSSWPSILILREAASPVFYSLTK